MIDRSNHSQNPFEDEEETYRLAGAEPKAEPASAPPAEPRKRKRRKRPRASEGSGPPPEPVVEADEPPVAEDGSWEASWEEARRQKEERLGYSHGMTVDESQETLLSSMWYPLTGQGALVLPAYAALLCLATSGLIPFVGMIVSLVVGAYVSLLFLETANFTLERVPSGPRFPGLDWNSFSAGMMGLIATLIARLPHLIGTILMRRAEVSLPIVEQMLLAVGMVYIPMAFLALSDLESERGLNPLYVVRGIGRMPGPYFALVGLAGAAYFLPMLALILAGAPGWVQALVSSLLLLYVLVVLMRAMALVYRRRKINLES